MPTGVYSRISLEKRFWSKVEKTPTCWDWIGGKDSSGYGEININSKPIRVYRWSYEQAKGKIPKGLVIDHLCRNRACVNPVHLEIVTNLENFKRSPTWNGNKIHCKRGHKFTKENTYFRKDVKGRNCKICHKQNQQTPEAREKQKKRTYKWRKANKKNGTPIWLPT